MAGLLYINLWSSKIQQNECFEYKKNPSEIKSIVICLNVD